MQGAGLTIGTNLELSGPRSSGPPGPQPTFDNVIYHYISYYFYRFPPTCMFPVYLMMLWHSCRLSDHGGNAAHEIWFCTPLACTHTCTSSWKHIAPLWLCWHKHTHTLPVRLFFFFLPQAPSYFKRKNLLSTMCVCTGSAASVNFKACISANSIAGLVLGDHVSGLKALYHVEIIQTSLSSDDVFYICCGG